MPQPKQTWLDRLFGGTRARRGEVPPNRPVATSGSGRRPTRENPSTVATRSSVRASQEPVATPPSVHQTAGAATVVPPELPPEVRAGMQRTASELAVIASADLQRQQQAALNHSIAMEQAALGMSQQQQQMTNYSQLFRSAQQMTGMNNPLFGGDPDPRNYLP